MKNDALKLRSDKKEQIINSLEQLEKDFDEYFQLWKKCGGGTTGHAIGSAIKRVHELREFTKAYC